MQITGVTRRIDDLGRITIPKEIRQALRLREGDPVECRTDGNVLYLEKQVEEDISRYGKPVGAELTKLTGFTVAVCDIDKIVYISGEANRRLRGCGTSDVLNHLTETLCTKDMSWFIIKPLQAVKEYPDRVVGVIPIINNARSVFGAILFLETAGRESPELPEIKMAQAAATTLGSLFNE
jgi:stage V sporulation protein T